MNKEIPKVNKEQNKKDNIEKDTKNKKKQTYYQLGCNGCHKTNVTLIKCTDSYYCPQCMKKLGKKKFVKEKKR